MLTTYHPHSLTTALEILLEKSAKSRRDSVRDVSDSN